MSQWTTVLRSKSWGGGNHWEVWYERTSQVGRRPVDTLSLGVRLFGRTMSVTLRTWR